MLQVGDYAPWFDMSTTTGSEFSLQRHAGKHVVLCFLGSTSNAGSRRILDDIERQVDRFPVGRVAFVGISVDPKDAALQPRREQDVYLCDSGRQVSSSYEVISPDQTKFQPQAIILDPLLRVASVVAFEGEPESCAARLLGTVDTVLKREPPTGHAPIMIVPDVFEPTFCRELIRVFEQTGGHDGVVLRDVDGRPKNVVDHSLKTRREEEYHDPAFAQAVHFRIARRLIPELRRAYQFQAACLERHLVCCYDAAQGGRFKAHRDNGTSLAAHRKFAISINLNAEEFEGGELCFPEYGIRLYKGPTGAAVVFSCTLLHEARPVTKGRRYVYLPFLYDREGFFQRVLLEQRICRSAKPSEESDPAEIARARQLTEAHLGEWGF
jgi:peroxiredoxin/predicted 2-oxoglutarate/Fe(II)-dependent dioxygenase YbiX